LVIEIRQNQHIKAGQQFTGNILSGPVWRRPEVQESKPVALDYIGSSTCHMKQALFLYLHRTFSKAHSACSLVLLLLCHTATAQEGVKSNVRFFTTNKALQTLYDTAERKATWNLQTFGPYKVLVEGAGYQNVWLETQPMGGYMYAKRNVEVARNNQTIFMDLQRADGRMPGMISFEKGKLVPHYGWFQGFCFPQPAFEMWYWLNKDTAYLHRLYGVLKKFDAYLWQTRDSDGDGCLETWCVWDTGEDDCIRLEGAPNFWPFDEAPTPEKIASTPEVDGRKIHLQRAHDSSAALPVPMESMDVMSYSYAARDVLARIAAELKNGEEKSWRQKAAAVRTKLKSYLWDNERKACFDRDPQNKVIDILMHNSLRCMYYGSFDQAMADAFVKHHLLNKREFWTPMPLPSIAANDPAFRNTPGNNWSGQPQGLTYQRAIQALENYGHYAEVALVGKKLLEATQRSLRFTQQFDPFTGKVNNTSDGYGPAILAVLEYIERMHGVYWNGTTISWSGLRSGDSTRYEQVVGENVYALTNSNGILKAFINNKPIFSGTAGVRVVTDLQGNIQQVIGIDSTPHAVTLTVKGKGHKATVVPNAVYKIKSGKLALHRKVPFDYKP
jgi:hypothetical protein